MDQRQYFPEELLNEFAEYFEWIVDNNPLNTLYLDPELKKFFFDEFVGGIAKRLSLIKELPDINLPLVSRIVLSLGEIYRQEIERDNSEMADAMRYLLDSSCPLHQNLFQSEESSILKASYNPGLVDQLSEEEKQWRKSLDVGSNIDAIKRCGDYNMKMWAKAQVLKVDGDLIHVKFENDSYASSTSFWWYSPEIDIYNSKSEGDEWRSQLQIGDKIDTLDSTRIWYRATVLNCFIKEEEGNQYPVVRIGFRIYHPEGDKLDNDKKPFTGWSEAMDETFIAYSPRIQKFGTFAKSFEESRAQLGQRIEESLEDQMDQLLFAKNPSNIIYAVARPKHRSGLLVTLLNRLGRSGFFDMMLERIQKNDDSTVGLETVYYYLDQISKCSPVLNKLFIDKFYPALYSSSKQKVLTSSESLLRNFKKDRLDMLVQTIFGGFMTRILAFQPRDLERNSFMLDIGIQFLRLNFLEKRIDGAKMISEVCKNANLMSFTSSMESSRNQLEKQQNNQFIQESIKKIKGGHVLNQMFSKERGHLQMVERAEELLKLLIGQDALTNEDLDLIWTATKLDETTKLEVYKLFNELSSRLKHNEITFIIDQLSHVPLPKVIQDQVSLVHEIGKRAISEQCLYGSKVAEYLLRIAIPNTDTVDKVVINLAGMAFTDVIKNWSNPTKKVYFQRIAEALQSNQEGYLCIKMMVRIFRDFQGEVKSQQPEAEAMDVDESSQPSESLNPFENKSTFIEHVEESFDMMESFFLNFTHYIHKARQALRQKQAAEPQTDPNSFSEKVLADRFIHSDQMTERFDFLKYIAQNSSVKVTKGHLSLLWRDLVQFQMFKSDSDQFYRFLKDVCDLYNRGYHVVGFKELIEFFQEQVFSNTADEQVYAQMTSEGFSSISSFFTMLNHQEGKILRLLPQSLDAKAVVGQYPAAPKMTSFSSNTGGTYQNYSFANKNNGSASSDNEDHGFYIQVAPWDLEGIDGIWKIAINAVSNEVYSKASSLLIKLYTCPTFDLEHRLTEFEDSFIKVCMDRIKEIQLTVLTREEQPREQFEKIEKPISKLSTITTTVTQRVQPPEERKILKYLNLVKEIVKNSEKDGNRGVKSHNGLYKGTYLDCLQISNSLRTGTKFQTKLELGVNSNITLFELRKIIGEHVARVHNNGGTYIQETPSHPYSVRIYRYSGCADIPETDNGRTLAELKFKRNEQLTVYKKSVTNSSRLPLMSQDGNQMNPRLIKILNDAFDRFSDEAPTPENPQNRQMNKIHLKSLISVLTDDDTKEDDIQLNQIFFNYSKDGVIQREDYLHFWRNSVFNDEMLVWQNIFNLGYRYDLKMIAQDGMDDQLHQVRRTAQDMPRYKLSANQEYFESLFSLVETMNSDVSQASWSLIKNLSTNPILFKKVLVLDRDPGFQWSEIFDSQSLHKMLYVLQMVEALLEECSQMHEQHNADGIYSEEESFKLDWVQRFMSLEGFQQILQMFHKSLEIISSKEIDKITQFEKNFLEQMLKLIRIFVLAAYSIDDDDNSVFEVLQMVKNKSVPKDEGVKEGEPSTEQSNYQTPAKKSKSKFVQRMHEKRVQFVDNFVAASDITEDFLFGDVQTESQQPAEQIESQQQLVEVQQQSPEDNKKRFSALAKIMKQSGQGTDILEKIDFTDLQAQVIEVVCLILQKKEVHMDESLIVENALGLWVATLVKNNNLINKFYELKRPWATQYFAIKNVHELISHGIFTYKSAKIREDFSNAIQCIAQKVQNNTGLKPVLFFIDLMRKNYPREDLYYVWRECKHYFDLFTGLIDEYFAQHKEGTPHAIDIYEILIETLTKLKTHECKEKKTSLLEDKTLIGFFGFAEKLINMIVNKYGGQEKLRLSDVITQSKIIDTLFQDYLFFNPDTQEENKCQTKESRGACFNLLQKLIETLQPHQLNEFLSERLWSMIEKMQRPKAWKFVPQDNSKTALQSSYVGLVNLGCICYMNSMLQQFFMVPQFRYQLLKAIDETPRDLKEYKGYHIDDSLLRQMQIMFANLELSERQAFYPLGFCFAFKDFDGNPTNTAIQQDAQEFLNIFFARLEELIKPTTQKHLLDSVFGGKVVSQLKCPSCGNIRNLLESFFTLTVNVKDRRGLLDSLQKMIESSVINDFRCENCKQKVDVEKRQLIAEPPNVLIVHLQRIIFNFDTFQNDKINSYFDFPNILDLKDFSYKKVMNQESHSDDVMANDTTKHLLDIQDDEYIYKLVGVTIHRGTAEHGHYYSLINTRRGKEELDEARPEWYQTEKDNWKVFDDENVKAFTFSEMRTEAFGGSSSAGNSYMDSEMSAYYMQSGAGNSYGQNAYMLVYEKMIKKPLKEVILPPKVQEPVPLGDEKMNTSSDNVAMDVDEQNSRRVATSLECIDTAVSRASVEPTSIAAPMPTLAKNASEIEHVDQNAEKFNMISYKKVEPFVPEWIKQQVLLDNTMFMIDRHIYSEHFFNFIKLTLKHIANNIVMTQYQYQSDYVPHFNRLKHTALKIAGKVMFDMLAYYNYNMQMADITSSLQTILTFSDSAYTLSKGEDSIILEFLKEYYLADGCQHFLNIMFQCTDKTSRFYIGKLTSNVINKIYGIYQDCLDKEPKIPESLQELKEIADSLVVKFFQNLKTPECIKNWQKIENYLQMLYDIASDGPLQQDLLLTRFDIVAFLLEFLMANCSQKTSSKLSNFSNVVSLICFFLRFSLTPPMRQECQHWTAGEEEEGPKTPATLIGWDVNKMRGQPERYPLKDEQLDFILESDFVEMTLREGVETQQLGKMIAHLCFKYEKFSKRIAKLLLHGISRNDYEKVKNYLDVVIEIALIRDEYQSKRLEWLFGYGSLVSHTQNVKITNDPNEMMIKVGVKVLHSLSDEVYAFKSSLIQDTTDDALLHLLWRYKGRMDTYTVNCLQSLLSLIAQDENVAEYFAKLPGPTYCLSRYTDWFQPYLEKQLAEAKKGYAGAFSTEKEEIVVKCLSLFEKYTTYLKKQQVAPSDVFQIFYKPLETQEEEKMPLLEMEIDQEEENVRNLISSASLQRGDSDGIVAKYDQPHQTNQPEKSTNKTVLRIDPQPYIIIDSVSEKQVFTNDYGNVILEISALGCFYTESLPTGDSNLAIPQGLFKKSTVPKQGASQTYEQNMQAAYINNYFQAGGMLNRLRQDEGGKKTPPKGSKQRRNGVLVSREIEEERIENDVDDLDLYGPPAKKVIKDDDEQWQMINKAQFQDDQHPAEENVSFDSNHENKNSESEPVYRIRVIEEGEETNNMTSGQDNKTPAFITQNENPQGVQGDVQMESEQVDVQWPNQVNFCEDLVYRISVTNFRDVPIKCTINFKVDDEFSFTDVNLFFPRGGFKASVQGKDSKTILMLHKYRPESVNEVCEINKIITNFKFSEKFIQTGKGSAAVPSSGANGKVAPAGYTALRHRNAAQVHPIIENPDALINAKKNADVNLNDSNHASFNDNDDSDNEWQAQMFDPDAAVVVGTNNQQTNNDKADAESQPENKQDNNQNEYTGMVDQQYLDQKQCPICTFLNNLESEICGMCYTNF